MGTFADNWNDLDNLTEGGKYPGNSYYYRLVNFITVDQLIDSIPDPGAPEDLKLGEVTKGLHQQEKPIKFHEEFHLTVAKYQGNGSYHLFVKVLEPMPGKFYDLQAVGYSTTAHDRINFAGTEVAAVQPTKWRTQDGKILPPQKWVWPSEEIA